MYVIVILLKYIFEWCIWYWAVFKGLALGISPSYYEQVTWILETARPGPWFIKAHVCLSKEKTFLWFSNVSSVNLPDPALCNDVHYMNSVSSTAATKLLTSQYNMFFCPFLWSGFAQSWKVFEF